MISQQGFQNNKVICFGEVLWDIFPGASRAGGAPFNVAYNLRKLGVDSRAISRVGDDELGRTLENKLLEWGFPKGYLQIDPSHPTGTVIANFDEYKEAHYNILYPVAYDYIEQTAGLPDEVSQAAAFVFGSLIARSELSRNTLFSLLEAAKLKVFDINLREPYCDFEVIESLMHKSDIVKMNKSELRRMLEHLGVSYTKEYDAVRFIQEHFNLNEVLLSIGSKGAIYYKGQLDYFTPAIPIMVADTVGSGDAFLAGFISKRINNAPPIEIINYAVALGAYITSQEGACPEYTLADFNRFVSDNSRIHSK
jgi:fructokinase